MIEVILFEGGYAGLQLVEGGVANFCLLVSSDRFAALGRAVVAAEASVKQTQTLYKSGLTDFQNVLNMERDLFEQQNLQAASEGEIARRIVDIFRALGGGWQDASEPLAAR